MAEDNLGGLFLEKHDVDDAMPHFYRAAAINPGDPTSNLNVGAYEQSRGNPQKAIEYYQRVLHSPQSPPNVKAMATSNLEKAYAQIGVTAPPPAAKPCPARNLSNVDHAQPGVVRIPGVKPRHLLLHQRHLQDIPA